MVTLYGYGMSAEPDDFWVGGTAWFADGQMEVDIWAMINDDADPDDEIFYVGIMDAGSYTVDWSRSQAEVTIEDDDLPIVSLDAAVSLIEGTNTEVVFYRNTAQGELTVNFQVHDMNAPEAASMTGSVHFAEGQISQSYSLDLNDTNYHDDQFTLQLDSSDDYTFDTGGGTSSISVTDDDTPPDLDIDSDNNNGLAPPDRTTSEESIENAGGGWVDIEDRELGKVIGVNVGDTDEDGVPNFADGINRFGNEGSEASDPFTPIVLQITSPTDLSNVELRFQYAASDPANVQREGEEPFFEYSPDSNGAHLRLWTKNGDVSRNVADVANGGDFIAPNTAYTPAELGLQSSEPATFYVEGIAPSTDVGDQPIQVEVYVADEISEAEGGQEGDGEEGEDDAHEFEVADTVYVTLFELKMLRGLMDPDSGRGKVGETDDILKDVEYGFDIVSNPIPLVEIESASFTNIHRSGGTGPMMGTLQVSGTVTSALADIVPNHEADPQFVYVRINGEDNASFSVTRVEEETSLLRPFVARYTFSGTAVGPALIFQNSIEVIADNPILDTNDCVDSVLLNVVSQHAIGGEPVGTPTNTDILFTEHDDGAYRFRVDLGPWSSLNEAEAAGEAAIQVGFMVRAEDGDFETFSAALTDSLAIPPMDNPDPPPEDVITVVALNQALKKMTLPVYAGDDNAPTPWGIRSIPAGLIKPIKDEIVAASGVGDQLVRSTGSHHLIGHWMPRVVGLGWADDFRTQAQSVTDILHFNLGLGLGRYVKLFKDLVPAFNLPDATEEQQVERAVRIMEALRVAGVLDQFVPKVLLDKIEYAAGDAPANLVERVFWEELRKTIHRVFVEKFAEHADDNPETQDFKDSYEEMARTVVMVQAWDGEPTRDTLDLALAYEIASGEGFTVFGIDAWDDVIATEAGALLGEALASGKLNGESISITNVDELDLAIEKSFKIARESLLAHPILADLKKVRRAFRSVQFAHDGDKYVPAKIERTFDDLAEEKHIVWNSTIGTILSRPYNKKMISTVEGRDRFIAEVSAFLDTKTIPEGDADDDVLKPDEHDAHLTKGDVRALHEMIEVLILIAHDQF